MGNARTIRFAVISWLCTAPALADIPGCTQADMPPVAEKALQKAARRAFADPLDLTTVYYCTQGELAQASVDTVPVRLDDGSENGSTLLCSAPVDEPRHWSCEVNRYHAIRVAPAPGQPEVVVEVGDSTTVELTRDRASRAFALLHQAGRVESCPGTVGPAQSTASILEILARRSGPYRLVIAREGFALMRAHVRVRFKSGVECWEETKFEE